MARRFQAPATVRLEGDAERVRRSHAGCILELQTVPIVGGKLVRDVRFEDGVAVPIAHSLGRRATYHLSPARSAVTAGAFLDSSSAVYDPEKFVVVRAEGFGATVTADVWIY